MRNVNNEIHNKGGGEPYLKELSPILPRQPGSNVIECRVVLTRGKLPLFSMSKHTTVLQEYAAYEGIASSF